MATSERIREFLAQRPYSGPCLVVDLDIVRENFQNLAQSVPDARIFYAVKANPAPEILALLAAEGACFDTASVVEIELALAAGATPDRVSFGNTIKKEKDIAHAYGLGVRLFAFDSQAELEKIARVAPKADVFCRILTDGTGAEWPLSRKFGCAPAMAEELLEQAHRLGLGAAGISFHVGSQQKDLTAWDRALGEAGQIFRNLAAKGIMLRLVNMGGGFPTRYLSDIPAVGAYGEAIRTALLEHFGNRRPEIIIEPGRGMVGNAGTIQTEVVLIAQKSAEDTTRWVYLDIGKFGGLAETMDEAIRYPIVSERDQDAKSPCVLAGPTCDSADVLYEKAPYPLPVTLEIGDLLLIEATGAYTTTYASVAFNGFAPLQAVCI